MCKKCPNRQYESITPPGHKFNGSFETLTEPTCTENGERVGKCINCGDVLTRTIIPAKHKYGEWEIVIKATCTEDGLQTRTCADCNRVETEIIPKIGGAHTFNGSFETIEPTCTEDGARIARCTRCGDILSETVIEKLGGNHQFNGSFTITKEPTCVEEGIRAAICIKCGDTLQESAIPKVDHTWGEWEIVETPTENSSGLKKRTCGVCELVEEEEIYVVAELTVEDCGYDNFYFRTNGNIDGDYSSYLSYYETDEYGDIAGRVYLCLRFTTNVDWSVSAPSNVNVVDFNGKAHYSGTAGENCILVYMDEVSNFEEEYIIESGTLTITANEKSVSYGIGQCNYIINGLGKDDHIEKMNNIIGQISGYKNSAEAIDYIKCNRITNGSIEDIEVGNFKHIAVKSEKTSYNEIKFSYILYQVEINSQSIDSKGRLEVIESGGLMLKQGSAPIFTTNGTINGGLSNSVDQVYEREVAFGERIVWGVSTTVSFLLGFVDGPSPVADFAIGMVVDSVIGSAGSYIISINTTNNGDDGVITTTTFTLNDECILRDNNNKIEMTCINNNTDTTLITINWVVTDGTTSNPQTCSN